MISPGAQATLLQLEASNPQVSAFVSASAGSGKTKLLTDRLLRLLLSGAHPGGIYCLTYTKAAAAEMAVRLQKRLGQWVTIEDHQLDDALRALAIEPSEALRRTARNLFGRVLDLPGGMRIGTIHSFCQGLLRRFPLEAALPPHFELAEERDSEHLLNQAIEQTLSSPDAPVRAAIARVAAKIQLADLHDLLHDMLAHEDGWARLAQLEVSQYRAALRQALNLRFETKARVMEDAVTLIKEACLRAHLPIMAAAKGARPKEYAESCRQWLELSPAGRIAAWRDWRDLWLKTTGREVKSIIWCLTKVICDAHPAMIQDWEDEQRRIQDCEDQLGAVELLECSTALVQLAKIVATRFARAKRFSGLLDFGDLITATKNLLHDPGVAWVRFKLDEGIDHILLDEVQDTSPSQWQITDALREDFFAGQGAKETSRTVFAVGDLKQSIYSFQGADPGSFERERARLRHQVRAAGQNLAEPALNISFRSAPAILSLTDHIFRNPIAARGVGDSSSSGWLHHEPERAGQHGLVELWPLTPPPAAAEPLEWQTAGRYSSKISSRQRLADAIACWIKRQLEANTMLPSRKRALQPGDILVLVRRRNDFVRALNRALKQQSVPVAGLDRMKLLEEIAVQDLLALCRVLLLPEDDLSLAEMLKSPLGGLDDDSLMQLALGRGGLPLFYTLARRAAERPDWRQTWTMLQHLQRKTDFITPHALLAEILGPLGGRARLLQRLGADAAEPIAELLAAALRFADLHPPSLQSFLQWLAESGAEIKREADASGGLVRIMTVHGAKGLQAPLVILPDTVGDGETRTCLYFPKNINIPPFWYPGSEADCAAARDVRDQAREDRQAEHNRLLYVALTRAEDRLLVCGALPASGKIEDHSWYKLIEHGFASLSATPDPFDAIANPWPGQTLRFENRQAAEPDRVSESRGLAIAAPPPAWAGAAPDWRPLPLPAEPRLPRPLAPSRPQDADLGPAPPAASPAGNQDRFARGKLVHALLQHLPDLPAAARPAAARRAARDYPEAADQILALITAPRLADLFGPHSRGEVPVSGLIGGQVVQGVIDRLAVLENQVIIADYKSNRTRPRQTPVLYLRQMAAYRALVLRIYPRHAVKCLLVWSQDATITELTEAELAPYAPS